MPPGHDGGLTMWRADSPPVASFAATTSPEPGRNHGSGDHDQPDAAVLPPPDLRDRPNRGGHQKAWILAASYPITPSMTRKMRRIWCGRPARSTTERHDQKPDEQCCDPQFA